MKKMIAVAVVALMLCSAVFAQVTVGVRGGLATNMGTNFTGDFAEAIDAMSAIIELAGGSVEKPLLSGASFGAYAKVAAAPSIFVQPEVNYNMANGINLKVTYAGDEATQSSKFTTIDIPVLVGYELACGPVTVAPFAGPQVSFITGKFKDESKDDAGIFNGTNTSEEKITAKTMFGAVLGCGVTYPVSDAIEVGADVRFAMDFNAFSAKFPGDTEYEDILKRKALSFNVSAGYKF